jgi:hypothetical protein
MSLLTVFALTSFKLELHDGYWQNSPEMFSFSDFKESEVVRMRIGNDDAVTLLPLLLLPLLPLTLLPVSSSSFFPTSLPLHLLLRSWPNQAVV